MADITKVGSTVPVVANVVSAGPVSPGWAGDMPRTYGDLLIARTGAFTGQGPLTCSDPDWKQVTNEQSAGNTRTLIWYRMAQGGDAAPTFSSASATIVQASLEEFTPGYLQGFGRRGQTTTTTTTVPNPGGVQIRAARLGGISITSFAAHLAAPAVQSETPGSGWTSSGLWTTSSSLSVGGDYHLNPDPTVDESELITLGQSADFLESMIALFMPGLEPVKFSIFIPGPRSQQ